MNNIFKNVGSAKPKRSQFNLSYDKKGTCDMGQLIPVQCDMVIPGDFWDIGVQALLRMQPLVAPVMHEIDVSFHSFFVPYRLCDDDFEDAITGGDLGTSSAVFPTWSPSDVTEGSLWDFLGFPIGVTPDADNRPLDFPRIAYNMIYNEFYRDQNLITEVALTNEDILLRAWEKDYFTSALPWQQKGTAPSVPLEGTGFADFTNVIDGTGSSIELRLNPTTDLMGTVGATTYDADFIAAFNKNEIDFSSAGTFNISDLRLMYSIQAWMERNARAGSRYVEFLYSHFSIAPRDERLDIPEYIGGSKQPVIVTEVLQTESSDAATPQGTMAGHGITGLQGNIGKYRVTEFGLIMTIMSIMPKPVYMQGMDRQWRLYTKYDFPFPEFTNLSEQAIQRAEIYLDGNKTNNETVFGYQGRFDEHRVKRSMVVSGMRPNAATPYDYWHCGMWFAAAPSLNQTFIECDGTDAAGFIKDIFAVPSEPGFIFHVGNAITASRPLPFIATPGLLA